MCPYRIFQLLQFHSGSSRCVPDQKHVLPFSTSCGPLTLYMLNMIPTQFFGIEQFGEGGIVLGINNMALWI